MIIDQVTSNTAPAHPQATGVAVYPALFTLPVTCFAKKGKAELSGGGGE